MPRWLVVLGIVAACTLLVALLRYAIDLLGVVFLIILVGFSIRAVSDWLTEGESVSAWALAAVFAGLFGTVLVGLWLFGSRDMTAGALERGVPSPVLKVADWLEAHGWGQRVLLAGGGSGGPSATAMSGPGGESPVSAPSSGPVAARGEPAPAAAPSRSAPSESASHERRGAARSAPGEAEAATPSSSGSAGRTGSRSSAPSAVSPNASSESAPAPANEASAPAQPEESSVGTSTSLSSSHSSSPVGVSVRFTATVTADGTGVPSGSVVFFDGDRVLGTAPVRGAGSSVTAAFSTLTLAIGDHQISAQYLGSGVFQGSRSEAITQTITRH